MSREGNNLDKKISIGFLEGEIVQRALPTPSQGEDTCYNAELFGFS